SDINRDAALVYPEGKPKGNSGGKMAREKPYRLNFTKSALSALAERNRRTVYHDLHVHGLCLRVEPTGTKAFCWFRKVNGRPTFKRIGTFPDLTIEQARVKAAEFNS